jgi:hypothetical protein
MPGVTLAVAPAIQFCKYSASGIFMQKTIFLIYSQKKVSVWLE